MNLLSLFTDFSIRMDEIFSTESYLLLISTNYFIFIIGSFIFIELFEAHLVNMQSLYFLEYGARVD